MEKLKHYFFTPDYLNVFDLDQIYMTSSMWYDTGMKDTWVTFDLLVRDMPKHRNFLVFTGLEEMALFLQDWKFTDKQIAILKNAKLISNNFAKYLKKFSFSGDVFAMSEGSIFYNNEPVLRITAPLIEANLLTAFFMTSLSSNTIFSSKYIRSIIAAKGKSVIGPSANRAHSFESAFKAQRSAFIVGSNNCPSPIVRKLFGMPMDDNATIAYHAFIKSYTSESEAMQVAAKNALVDLSLMVDTFSYESGVKNAIKIAKEYAKKNRIIKFVVDSGDLYKNAVYVKKEVKKAGLKNVKITVASNLDEYKIKKLISKGIPADTFIVGTEAVTSSDDPKLEVIYKISEIIKPDGSIVNKMKLSPGKTSLPGRKQVFRLMSKNKLVEDTIGLEGESNLGISLLQPIFKKGKLVYNLPSILTIRDYVSKQVKYLPSKYLEINKVYKYPVKISEKLKQLIIKTKKEIK
jgi:nicotinate phosphoribosyltransferase